MTICTYQVHLSDSLSTIREDRWVMWLDYASCSRCVDFHRNYLLMLNVHLDLHELDNDFHLGLHPTVETITDKSIVGYGSRKRKQKTNQLQIWLKQVTGSSIGFPSSRTGPWFRCWADRRSGGHIRFWKYPKYNTGWCIIHRELFQFNARTTIRLRTNVNQCCLHLTFGHLTNIVLSFFTRVIVPCTRVCLMECLHTGLWTGVPIGFVWWPVDKLNWCSILPAPGFICDY